MDRPSTVTLAVHARQGLINYKPCKIDIFPTSDTKGAPIYAYSIAYVAPEIKLLVHIDIMLTSFCSQQQDVALPGSSIRHL